jgi:hypothetical protein
MEELAFEENLKHGKELVSTRWGFNLITLN